MSGRKERDGKTLFRSPDGFERHYFPETYRKRKEREKTENLTDKERAEYEGKNAADASVEKAGKEAGL